MADGGDECPNGISGGEDIVDNEEGGCGVKDRIGRVELIDLM